MRTVLFLLQVVAGQAAVTLRRIFKGPLAPGWTIPEERTRRLVRTFVEGCNRWGFAWVRRLEGRALPLSAVAKSVPGTALESGGVRGQAYVSSEGDHGSRIVVYFHGGGYCIGSPATYREIMSRLALGSSSRVLAPIYRLAPEHPHPAAGNDCLAFYRGLLAGDARAERIVFAGDSAGGALALATLVSARDEGLAMPAGAVIFSPWVDPSAEGGSMTTNEALDAIDRTFLNNCIEAYLGGETSIEHPLISLLLADLRGLPPLLIQVGEAEMFLDQDRALAKRARQAGVDVDLRSYPGLFHTFQNHLHELPSCARAVEESIAFVEQCFARS